MDYNFISAIAAIIAVFVSIYQTRQNIKLQKIADKATMNFDVATQLRENVAYLIVDIQAEAQEPDKSNLKINTKQAFEKLAIMVQLLDDDLFKLPQKADNDKDIFLNEIIKFREVDITDNGMIEGARADLLEATKRFYDRIG